MKKNIRLAFGADRNSLKVAFSQDFCHRFHADHFLHCHLRNALSFIILNLKSRSFKFKYILILINIINKGVLLKVSLQPLCYKIKCHFTYHFIQLYFLPDDRYYKQSLYEI